MVIGSLCSLSADPPLVLFSAGAASRTGALVEAAGVFAASILGAEQGALFERFAGRDPAHDADRFAGLAVAAAATGAPIFPEAVAWVDCRVVARHPGATYTLFVGEVVAAGLGRAAEASPLVYYRRERRRLLDPAASQSRSAARCVSKAISSGSSAGPKKATSAASSPATGAPPATRPR
jgi:flavin reductase (DIM6/NTAB) family NADH-FMN oxidoreductase RutF